MKPITETMRWALEQAIRPTVDQKAPGPIADVMIRELERTHGEYGVPAKTLVAALRIACRELDFINRKIQHGCTDMSCGLCDKERLK